MFRLAQRLRLSRPGSPTAILICPMKLCAFYLHTRRSVTYPAVRWQEFPESWHVFRESDDSVILAVISQNISPTSSTTTSTHSEQMVWYLFCHTRRLATCQPVRWHGFPESWHNIFRRTSELGILPDISQVSTLANRSTSDTGWDSIESVLFASGPVDI
eukprot:178910_1